MNYIVFDGYSRTDLLPFTFTRPVAALRVGIITIAEKWQKHLGVSVSWLTQDYLQPRYELKTASDNVLINGSLLPDAALVAAIKQLQPNEAIVAGNEIMAVRLSADQVKTFDYSNVAAYKQVSFASNMLLIRNTWDIFKLNETVLQSDFTLLTQGRTSAPISASNKVIAPENVFLEAGAKVECSIINATNARVYIGHNAEIMEGCMVRGSLALCEDSTLKMGAKIYGASTFGPHCKIGGEVNNSVVMGYSNKAHDGFLGNSVLGEWCNLGADTNNSNLKNNYAIVKLWNYRNNRFVDTGLQFCGLIMGDHSKSGINTMFNTGTVVGVSANIFGDGFPRNYIPSFSWGGAQGFELFGLNKAIEVAERVMQRRNMPADFVEQEKQILTHLFEQTKGEK